MTRGLIALRPVDGLHRTTGLTGPARPHRVRLAVLLATILLGLLLAAALLWSNRPPTSLDDVVLAGARPPGCVNMVIADDFSGSMTSFTAQRATAEQELVRWGRTNLRPDDRVTILAWAGTASVTVPPTQVDALDAAGVDPADLSGLGDGTELLPMLTSVTALPDTGCRIALMVISDSEIGYPAADPDRLRDQLGAAGVQSVSLLNPAGAQQSQAWQTLLPFTRVVAVDQSDPQDLSLALGREVANATGQQLARR